MIFYCDGNSTGFAIRDTELLLAKARKYQEQEFFYYCDERFVPLFSGILPQNVQLEGYPARSPNNEIFEACLALSSIREEKLLPLLPCGIQKPSRYIQFRENDLREHLDLFDGLFPELLDQRPYRQGQRDKVLPIIVSGLKPESDEGGDDKRKRIEAGRRQTFPFENIASVIHRVENDFPDYAMLPISVQYGDPEELQALFDEISTNASLRQGIWLPKTVDWNNDFLNQAKFIASIQTYCRQNNLPTISVGNASTYLHLILALGGFDHSLVAHDSEQDPKAIQNRKYWRNVALQNICGVKVFTQMDDNPGDWTNVTNDMCGALREISGATNAMDIAYRTYFNPERPY